MTQFYGNYTHVHCTGVYAKKCFFNICCSCNARPMKHKVDFTLQHESTFL